MVFGRVIKMTLKDELLEEFKGTDIVRPENFRSRLSFNFKEIKLLIKEK